MDIKRVKVSLPERHSGQSQIVQEAKRFNVLMCGRRFGKTSLGKDLAVEALLAGKRVGWCAPTYKILDGAWKELVEAVSALPDFEKNEQKLWMKVGTGGELEGWSLDTDDPARSRSYDLLIVDEAGLVSNLLGIWNGALRPTLADRRGTAWFFGTPKMRGDFTVLYNLGQGDDPEWKSWNRGMADNPFIHRSEIESLKRSLPEDDFRREVLGLPTDDGGNPFGYDAIVQCTAEKMPDAEHPDHRPVVWGWDLARKLDWTVGIALDFAGNVVRFERWQNLPWGETVKRIWQHTGDLPCWVDATGVGDPVVERLIEAGVDATPFLFTMKGKQDLMVRLSASIQMKEVTFPKGQITAELDAFQYHFTSTGTKYAAPEGQHDDCVMALALAVYGYDRVRPTVKATALLPPSQNQDPHLWEALVETDEETQDVIGYMTQLPEHW